MRRACLKAPGVPVPASAVPGRASWQTAPKLCHHSRHDRPAGQRCISPAVMGLLVVVPDLAITTATTSRAGLCSGEHAPRVGLTAS